MEQNFLIKALATMLDCEPNELGALYKFDTELGKEVSDLEFALQSHDNLNKIVYRLMDDVKVDVTYEAQDVLNDQLDDTTKDEIFVDNNIQVTDTKKLLYRLGYIRCIMPNTEKFLFDTELDKTVDFNLSVRDNAVKLIKYLVEQDVKKCNKRK